MRAPTFTDRRDAGRRLAQRLERFARKPGLLVVALPRGGIPVAMEVARALHAPLDVLDAPHDGGAGAQGRWHRNGGPTHIVRGATVVVVHDGDATGEAMVAAVRTIRDLGAARVIAAAPVMTRAAHELLRSEAHGIEYVAAPADLPSVAAAYRDFHDVSEAEMRALLRDYHEPRGLSRELEVRTVRIGVRDAHLGGDLCIPGDPAGLILFVHASGSSRTHPRTREIATVLQREGFATLLFDLLTVREEASDRLTDAYRFNIPLLTARLVAVTDWVAVQHDVQDLAVGYFAAGPGAAVALTAAARRETVQSVVSRGGQPDLAGDALAEVTAATLFIVGGLDRQLLVANRGARERMRRARTELAIIPGAGHLCEEREVLEDATRLAADWFRTYLPASWAATQ